MNTIGSQCVEMRIPVPWGHIAGKAWGNEAGHPVLGVHGWMDNCGTFDTLAPRLSKSLYFVAVDLPGHGFSSHLPPGVSYHYLDSLVCIRRIVKFLKWKRFSWIGHSMGAGLGAFYASVFPSEVDKLVMIDLVKPITMNEDSSYSEKMAFAIDAGLAIEEKIKPEPPTYTYDEAIDRLMKALDNAVTEKSAKILLTRGCRRVSEDRWVFSRDLRLRSPTLMSLRDGESFKILENIRCHNLLIKASEGPWFQSEEIANKTIEIYKKHCASFKFAEIPGNHFLHLNEPEKIIDMVNQHLTEDKKASL